MSTRQEDDNSVKDHVLWIAGYPQMLRKVSADGDVTSDYRKWPGT
jgi:hypothetical protein